MTTGSPPPPVRWTLCPRRFRWAHPDPAAAPSETEIADSLGTGPLLSGCASLVVVDPEEPEAAPESPTWRALLLTHPGTLLSATALGKACEALAASGVPLALTSVPGHTVLLVPAPLLGRALAALHQTGIADTGG